MKSWEKALVARWAPLHRAEALLLTHLDEEQREEYQKRRRFWVEGKREYQIRDYQSGFWCRSRYRYLVTYGSVLNIQQYFWNAERRKWQFERRRCVVPYVPYSLWERQLSEEQRRRHMGGRANHYHEGMLPIPDIMLSQKLMLETNEDGFHNVAR